MNPKQLGEYGERIACYYLKNKRYKILDRNYTKEWSAIRKGEIDIVVKKNKTISFVEVKTLQQIQDKQIISPAFSGGDYLPEDKVNFQKQRQLIKLSQNWLLEKKIPLESKWQIDVVSIKVDLSSKKAKIRHFENAVCQLR